MSGFVLDDDAFNEASRQLPDLDGLASTINKYDPSFISIKFPSNSKVPVAAVCLRDMLDTLVCVRYALYEFHANRIWYLEKSTPPNEPLATMMMRYYIDDAAFRLYSAGEHLANAIVCMLGIDDGRLDPYREGRVSQQSIVGHFLAREFPKKPITLAVLYLAQSNAWKNTIGYRSQCVHEQPPTVSGLGIVYKRKSQWKSNNDGEVAVSKTLWVGAGDPPDIYVKQMMTDWVLPATIEFTRVCREVVDCYGIILEEYGIRATENGISVDLFGGKLG